MKHFRERSYLNTFPRNKILLKIHFYSPNNVQFFFFCLGSNLCPCIFSFLIYAERKWTMIDTVNFHLEFILPKMLRKICDNEDERGKLGSSFYAFIWELNQNVLADDLTASSVTLTFGKYGKTHNPRVGRLILIQFL